MRNRHSLLVAAVVAMIVAAGEARAESDSEYWSRYSVTVPLYSDVVSLVVKPEWRFRNDREDLYLIKPEVGLALRVNRYLEITPHYVWQKSLTPSGWDHSDVSYLDATLKIPLNQAGTLKLIDRVRHQYNWDKETTIWRNSLRLTRALKLRRLPLSVFVEEEIFYSAQSDRLSESWTSAGVVVPLGKHIDLGVSYLLDMRRPTEDWTYANVLVTSVGLHF